jgi:hypothetical protein
VYFSPTWQHCPDPGRNDAGAPPFATANLQWRRHMGAILLWLLGVPIPIIIILLLLWH